MKKAYYFIPLFILALSITLLASNVDFYKQQMVDYDSHEEYVEDLLGFFMGDNQILGDSSQDLYSETEIIHLTDVQFLLKGVSFLVLFLALVVGFMLFHEDRLTIKDNLFKGGVYSIVFTGVLSLLFLNFDSAFTMFHKVFFLNDYWLLPSDAALIHMFPKEFFVVALTQIVLYSLIFSCVFIVLGIYIPGECKNGRRKKRT